MGNAQLQGELWGARAEDWLRFETRFVPLYEAVLNIAGVSRGSRLLDAGCGGGLALQRAVARGASVAGLDASPALVAAAARRVPDADIRIGEMEQLPYSAGEFDLVTGVNSFQYVADREQAMREARRVTKPGGAVTAAVWGPPEDCEMAPYISALGGLVPPPPAGTPGPWALSRPGALEALMVQAELTPVRDRAVTVTFSFADEAETLSTLLAPAPATRAIRHCGAERTLNAIRGAIADYRLADGSFAFENVFRIVVASV